MKLTSKQLAELLASRPHVTIDTNNPGVSHTRQEKREDAMPRKTDNRPGKAKGNGDNRQRFALAVTFRVSDNRRRDLDNMLSTVQDTLIDASGRLLAEYPVCQCGSGGGGKGNGGL